MKEQQKNLAEIGKKLREYGIDLAYESAGIDDDDEREKFLDKRAQLLVEKTQEYRRMQEEAWEIEELLHTKNIDAVQTAYELNSKKDQAEADRALCKQLLTIPSNVWEKNEYVTGLVEEALGRMQQSNDLKVYLSSVEVALIRSIIGENDLVGAMGLTDGDRRMMELMMNRKTAISEAVQAFVATRAPKEIESQLDNVSTFFMSSFTHRDVFLASLSVSKEDAKKCPAAYFADVTTVDGKVLSNVGVTKEVRTLLQSPLKIGLVLRREPKGCDALQVERMRREPQHYRAIRHFDCLQVDDFAVR